MANNVLPDGATEGTVVARAIPDTNFEWLRRRLLAAAGVVCGGDRYRLHQATSVHLTRLSERPLGSGGHWNW